MARRPKPRRPAARYPDFATYLAQTGDTQAAVARAMRISQAQVSRILAGQVVPRPALAIRLAAYAQIPIESFTWKAAQRRGAGA